MRYACKMYILLQVRQAQPLIIQADVMQEEMETCNDLEYSAKSIPLLLHQVRVHALVKNNINFKNLGMRLKHHYMLSFEVCPCKCHSGSLPDTVCRQK